MIRTNCRGAMALFALTASLAATPASAATLHVSAANTTGIENGTEGSPFSTLQPAINAAVAGDEILVQPGVYYGGLELKSNVPLVSTHGPLATIIDGMGGAQVITMPYDAAANVAIGGFTLRNASVGIQATNRVSFWSPVAVQISDCVLRDFSNIAVNVMPAAGVTLTRSVIQDSGVGVYNIWSWSPSLRNVTIDRVRSAIMPYQSATTLTNTTVTNVTNVVELWGSRGSGRIDGSNNNFFGYVTMGAPAWSGTLPYFALTNTLEVDPLFTNALLGDYSTQAGSPLIDAGVDVGLPYSGAAPDIGAWEHAPLSALEAAQALAESYAAAPLPAYKNAAEQRRAALQNKLLALIKKLDEVGAAPTVQGRLGQLGAALNELENDIWAKADGFFGGNPANDWITTQEEQARLQPKVAELRDLILADMAALQAQP